MDNPILENAINSIQVGFEDYFSGDERKINSSMRNIYAGILLLLKAKLKDESPDGSNDILIMKNIDWNIDNGVTIAHGCDGKTIGKDEIFQRLKKINIKLEKEAGKLINELADARNEIEHHFSTKPNELLKSAILESYIVINMLRKALYPDLTLDQIYGPIIHKSLKSDKEAHQKLKENLLKNWKKLDITSSIQCSECKSMLTDPKQDKAEITITCHNCGYVFTKTNLIEKLCNSGSFMETHKLIERLNMLLGKQTRDEKDKLIKYSESNDQIDWIREDSDVSDLI